MQFDRPSNAFQHVKTILSIRFFFKSVNILKVNILYLISDESKSSNDTKVKVSFIHFLLFFTACSYCEKQVIENESEL